MLRANALLDLNETYEVQYNNYKFDAITKQMNITYVPNVRELASPAMVVVVCSGSWPALVLEVDPAVVEVGVRSPLQP